MKKLKIKNIAKMIACLLSIVIFSFLFIQLLIKAVGTETEYPIEYTITNNLGYKVSLLDNEYYEFNELDEGLQYISAIVDKINLNYLFGFSTNYTTELDFNYKIVAKLSITEVNNKSKVLYSKEDIILEETEYSNASVKTATITKNLELDFQKYNEYVNSFNSSYFLSTESTLTVSAIMIGKSKYLDMDTKNSIQNLVLLKIPLGERTFSIDKEGVLEKNTVNIVEKSTKELINLAYLILAVGCLLTVCVFTCCLARLLNKLIPKKTEYYKTLKRILKDYDRIVVITNKKLDLKKYNIVDIISFEELLDVRDNLEKPILFYEVKTDVLSWFYIIENDNLYKYTLKASDVNEKK